MHKLLDRFFHYISFDTQSKYNARKVPSSDGQMKLAKVLEEELLCMGLTEIKINPQGCVLATLPANIDWHVPVIGFIAHLDTLADMAGRNIKPQLIDNYRGGEIALGSGQEVLSPIMFPVLRQLINQSLITTDGKTLLGADNKAGIAEIMTAIATLKQHNLAHGDIRIAFISDQTIGKGCDYLTMEDFNVNWAYCMDAGGVGHLSEQNFNVASAYIKIVGNRIHPGLAKGVMVNALILAMNFQQVLPQNEMAEFSGDDAGFFHLSRFSGGVELAEMHYMICDFSSAGFKKRKQQMLAAAERIGQGLHPDCYIEITITDTYYNMHDKRLKQPQMINIAEQAMRDQQIEPIIAPMRIGESSAKLSYRGIPCLSIFTGGYNSQSKHEFITVEGMEKAVAVIQRIAELTALTAKP